MSRLRAFSSPKGTFFILYFQSGGDPRQPRRTTRSSKLSKNCTTWHGQWKVPRGAVKLWQRKVEKPNFKKAARAENKTFFLPSWPGQTVSVDKIALYHVRDICSHLTKYQRLLHCFITQLEPIYRCIYNCNCRMWWIFSEVRPKNPKHLDCLPPTVRSWFSSRPNRRSSPSAVQDSRLRSTTAFFSSFFFFLFS